MGAEAANCSLAAMAVVGRNEWASPLGLTTGDMQTQKDWHMAYKDLANNMYRTSYQDMIHGKEIAVKSDMPSGYGGHIPSLRHDVLFKNTEFDRMRGDLKKDFGRDTMPSFCEQNSGLPCMTPNPRGRPQPPTHKTIPTYSNYVKPPWALTTHLNQPLTHRTTMSRRGESRNSMQMPLSARDARPQTTMAAVGSNAMRPSTPLGNCGPFNNARPNTSGAWGESRGGPQRTEAWGESRGGTRFAPEPTEEMELLRSHITGGL